MCQYSRSRRPERRRVRQTRKVAMTRYTLDSVRSCIWVSARSSLHPINTETRGVTGWFEAATREDGSLALDQQVAGELTLAVEKLTSGNQLYDRELRRRIDARRHPTIGGSLTRVSANGAHPGYVVTGEVSFHGKTLTFEHEMDIDFGPEAVVLSGEDTFDIRQFGMKPPSMLMVRVYPEVHVKVELHGSAEV
jgi:polyisoprenoid-binding protein YceI